MVIASFLASNLPLAAAAGAVAVFFVVWAIRWPWLSIWFLALSVALGQLVRIPLPGQGGGLLVSDIAMMTVLAAVGAHIIFSRGFRKRIVGTDVWLVAAFLPFFVWSLWLLVINSSWLGRGPFVVSLFYWLRLSAILLLLPACVWLVRENNTRRVFVVAWVFVFVVIAMTGLAQYFLVSDLSVLGGGWDPHDHRLVSTWLDPNFMGALLGMALLTSTTMAFSANSPKRSAVFLISATIFLAALVLTKSRSAWLATVLTTLLFSPFLILGRRALSSWAKVIIISLVTVSMMSGVVGVYLLGDRALGLIRGDETVRLRQEALQDIWPLASRHWLLGVGYNSYQYAALEEGLISDLSIHSRAGADNSALTLLVTTGVLGVTLFFVPWLILVVILLRRWILCANYQSFAATVAIVLLFIHSQFVNSFLYAHLLIALIVLVAWAYTSREEKESLCC